MNATSDCGFCGSHAAIGAKHCGQCGTMLSTTWMPLAQLQESMTRRSSREREKAEAPSIKQAGGAAFERAVTATIDKTLGTSALGNKVAKVFGVVFGALFLLIFLGFLFGFVR
jgi:hypothetical protein